MKLQEMYDYVAVHPMTTANVPREIRRAPVGIPYERAARLVRLGYLTRHFEGSCTRYTVTAKAEPYYHNGACIVQPRRLTHAAN